MQGRKLITGILGAAALVATYAGTAAAQSAAPAGSVAEGSLKGKTMTFVSFGGIYQEGQNDALKEFVEKSGVTLLNDGPTEMAKLKAQVDSGNVTWDVVDTGDLVPYVYCGTLFQKLDMSKLDISNIPPGQVGPCSVPAMNYGAVLMYKNETYKDNPPKSWKDFFDTKNFPGVRAIDGSGDPIVGLFEQAIMLEGGDVEKLTVADIDKAMKRLRELGPETIYWKTGAESQQLAESGEADMIIMWSGRAMAATKNGAKFTPVWNDWFVLKDQMTIAVGVKDTQAAYALINAYLGKQSQELLTQKTSYSPIHTQAKPKIDPVVEAFLTTTPERIKTGYNFHVDFWVANYPLMMEKWNALMAGN